jgi:DNA (cytosine-5)-methyltransferase 1
MKKLISVGTTFSGIGAPEQALKNINVQHVVKWACDIDKDAKNTYLDNHQCEIFFDDITKIDINELQYVDLYIFGFPCQDISHAGKQDLSQGRSSLVDYSLDIIDKIKPKWILFENVKALNSFKFKEFKERIIGRLNQSGYVIQENVYNSLYWGVPQNRERLFCLGTRSDVSLKEMPKQKSEQSVLDLFLDKNVDEQFYKICPSMLKAIFETKKCPIIHKDTFARCLTTKQDRSPNSGFVKEGERLRYLTPNECRKLQGFPETWIFPKSKYAAYKQFGNTMTVPILESIFSNIFIE